MMTTRSAARDLALTLTLSSALACPSSQVETAPPEGPVVAVTGLVTPPDPASPPSATTTTGGEAAPVTPPAEAADDDAEEAGEGEGDDEGGDGDGEEVAGPAPVASADLVTLVGERLPDHEVACSKRRSIPCERRGDLDDDGKSDAIVRVKARRSGAIGLAVLWGRGGVELLGGGRQAQWTVLGDEGANVEAIPASMGFLARWELVPADGPRGKRRGFLHEVLGRAHKFKAAKVQGEGILVDGGDAAAIAYWDGAGWRLLELGY
ncbi:MAG: hypothetical protein R3B09_12295 [Nannocystaceae bacterium]